MKQTDLRLALYILLGGLICTIIAPFVFTRAGIINFSETGPIGDTIGGITSPITNLIGAILVFYALKAQIESNELTRQQFERQNLEEMQRKKILYIAEQFNIIRQDLNDFSFSFTETYTDNGGIVNKDFNLRGSSAIKAYIKHLSSYNSKHNQEINIFETEPKASELKNLLQVINSFSRYY